MTNTKTQAYVPSRRERGLLAIAAMIMMGAMPFTYIFFFLPLLTLPTAILAVLVATGVIRNLIAVRIIQVLAVLGLLFNLWIFGILYNYAHSALR